MKNKVSGFLLVGVFIFIIYNIFNGYLEKYDVENNGKESIGKYVSHDSWGKGEVNIFKFYIGNKLIKANGGRAPEKFHENIGKFYRLKYSEKYNDAVRTFFDEQVTDTVEIFKAGLCKDDLK